METNVFPGEENYATEACGWCDTRTLLRVMCGRMKLANFRVFCKTAEVPCAWSNEYLTCTVVVGEGGLYWFIINHSKMRLLCCNITLGKGFPDKIIFCYFVFSFSKMMLLPHDCLLSYQSQDSLAQPVQFDFLCVWGIISHWQMRHTRWYFKMYVRYYLLVVPEKNVGQIMPLSNKWIKALFFLSWLRNLHYYILSIICKLHQTDWINALKWVLNTGLETQRKWFLRQLLPTYWFNNREVEGQRWLCWCTELLIV